MTTAVDHRLLTLLTTAARGHAEPSAEGVEVVGRPPGPCSAVVALSGRAVVAADVAPRWVHEYLPHTVWSDDEHHPALTPHFLAALAGRLGVPPAGLSTLLAAGGETVRPHGVLDAADADPSGWADYRCDVRTYHYRGPTGSGSVSVGRGPAGRWDAWIRLGQAPRHTPEVVRGRELLQAARTLVPGGAPVFVSVPVQAARSLRTAVSAGFEPLGAEVLFHHED